jgi:hypothetical protein
VQELGRAALARATPTGVPVTQRIGREGLDDTYNAISQRYDDSLSRIGIIREDQAFRQEIASRVNNAITGLPQPRATEVRDIITNIIANRQSPVVGHYTADIAKQVDSALGARVRDFRNASNDPDARMVANAIQGAQQAWRDLIRRNAPDQATRDMLDDANRAFANYIRVERATGKSAAEHGEFNATQLHQAVRETSGGGARKANWSRGDALMEDLSDPAKAVLSSKLGESGTVPRAVTTALLTGGFGGAAYGSQQSDMPNPITGLLIGAALSPALYSRAASRYAIGDLLPANVQNTLAEFMRASAPAAGLAGRIFYKPNQDTGP